jgi:hypothetical protein
MTQRKKWSDFTREQKAASIIAGLVQLVLLALALWDIRHRSPEEIRGDKRLWTAVCFVNYVGPLAYFLFGRKRCC